MPLRELPYKTESYPIHDEYRLFFYQGELIAAEAYHDVSGGETDFSEFAYLGDCFDSPFFSADVAKLEDGGWLIVEMGDGGVSILPPLLDPRELYLHLFAESLRD